MCADFVWCSHLKILFLSLGGTYPFRIGGPSVVAYNLVREFDKKGVEVDFVFGISRVHLSRTSNLSNLFGFSENISLIPIVKNERSQDSYKSSLDFKFLKDVNALNKRLKNEFDLIHFQWIPSTRDIFIPFLSWIRTIPTIFRGAGWITYETFVKRKDVARTLVYYDYFTFKFLKRFFTKIVCNSLYLKRKLVSDGLFRAEKIEVIPNGVNIEQFSRARKVSLSGDPALLFVGRLTHYKGIDTLTKTMKIIREELPEAVLHIVGDGPLMNQLKSFVTSDGLQKRVVFHGRITRGLPSFYASADICIFPSVQETFGITVIEAMAAGKPLIATNKGGVPENVQNFENGILIEPTIGNLIRAITDLWNDKHLMNKIALNNLAKAKDYDWSKIAERYITLYDHIVRT